MKALLLACDCAVAAGLAWLFNWLALIPLPRAMEAHWTERARYLWPARRGAAANLILLPADIALAQRLLTPAVAPPWPLAVFAAWLGAVTATYPFDRQVFPWLTPRAWSHQVLAGWTIRFGSWFWFFAVAASMPRQLNWRAWALASLFLVGLAIWVWGGLVWSCHKLRLLIPGPGRLLTIVTNVSARMQVTVRRVWLLRSSAISAAALPYTRDLPFSERLLSLHSDDEVAAICGHELGHLQEPRFFLASRFTFSALFFLPLLLIKPVAWTWGPGGVVVVAMLSWFFSAASRRLSRRLERRADQIAQANEPDPGGYAQALARLHQDNLIPAVMPGRRTHPDLYDRLLAVGFQPDYPRPQKPAASAPHTVALAVLLGFLIGLTFGEASHQRAPGILDGLRLGTRRELAAPPSGHLTPRIVRADPMRAIARTPHTHWPGNWRKSSKSASHP